MAKRLVVIDPKRVGKRKCGNCTGCCLVPTLSAPPVKGFGRCEKVKKDGCGIYDERPVGCREYSCHWLLNGFLERKHRPDKIGIIFDDGVFRTREVFKNIKSTFGMSVPPITVREIWEGALARNRELLKALSQEYALFLISADTTTTKKNSVMAPRPDIVKALEAAIEAAEDS